MLPSFLFSRRVCVNLCFVIFKDVWEDSPVKPFGPGVYYVGGFFYSFIFKNDIVMISLSILELWCFIFFEEFDHFI